jgi:hypothetical protein
MFIAFLMTSLIAGCAAKPEPVSNACAALGRFTPDPGFENRWTRREREHQVVTNDYFDGHCK